MSAIQAIRAGAPEVHVTCGLSNISYGLPNRALLNRTFLVQAVACGLDSAILDPLDEELMRAAYAAEALATTSLRTAKGSWAEGRTATTAIRCGGRRWLLPRRSSDNRRPRMLPGFFQRRVVEEGVTNRGAGGVDKDRGRLGARWGYIFNDYLAPVLRLREALREVSNAL